MPSNPVEKKVSPSSKNPDFDSFSQKIRNIKEAISNTSREQFAEKLRQAGVSYAVVSMNDSGFGRGRGAPGNI